MITTEECFLISIVKNFPERFELCDRYYLFKNNFEYYEISFINKTNNNIGIFDPYDYIYSASKLYL